MKVLNTDEKHIIQNIIADKLGYDLEEVHDEAEIRNELNADSLDEIELVMDLEREFNITIPDSDYEAYDNIKVKDLYAIVEKNS
jgi:acyl carrier protein